MSAHENLDDDLLQPPPSAQRPAWPTQVRSGIAVSRPIARHRHNANAATSSPYTNANPAINSIPGTAVHHERIPSASNTMPISESRHSNALGQPALLVPSPRFFDAWNSSSTGHQRAENRLSGSTSWRQSRNLKLGEQYKGGLAGGKRVSDTVGAGSEHFGKDGRRANGTWEKGAKGLREGSQKSLVELWSGVESTRGVVETSRGPDPPRVSEEHTSPSGAEQGIFSEVDAESSFQSPKCPTPIFEGLCFYVNGSTAPLVSDHHLKHVISLHGGAHSISLTRRTVTHCILGKGCGGGLSASKMQKEIAKTKKKSVRFVTVDWVLSSVKANRRLPETQFSALLPPKPQTSIGGQINKADHG